MTIQFTKPRVFIQGRDIKKLSDALEFATRHIAKQRRYEFGQYWVDEFEQADVEEILKTIDQYRSI
jgi:hypothetical protein